MEAGQQDKPVEQPQGAPPRKSTTAANLPAPSSAKQAVQDEDHGFLVVPPAPAAAEDAVIAQMGAMHKKFVGHVSLMYRELLKAMKAELGVQAAQLQYANEQLLAAALEAQKQQVS
jgi:hypothetical protein